MKIDPAELIEHMIDHPWPGCRTTLFGLQVTWMSSAIASMLVTAAVLTAGILLLARRRQTPSRGRSFLEVLVVFVRDMIAHPALGEKAEKFLPLLLTLFVFILGMNLMGIVPLESISLIARTGGYRVGTTATSVPAVCVGLASISLLSVVVLGLHRQAALHRRRTGRPAWVCGAISPLLWLRSLSPSIPGLVGKLLLIPMALLELMGAVAKCFSLIVRLFANILSGHALLAILALLVAGSVRTLVAGQGYSVGYVGPACVAAGVAVCLLELLVAGLQAYIFTFLTAMFLGLYVEADH